MEWETRVLEKGRVTTPQELRDRLGLRRGDIIKFSLEGSIVRLLTPKLEEDVVERTKGVLKGIESELTPEELEEAFLRAAASKIKAKKEEEAELEIHFCGLEHIILPLASRQRLWA